MKPISPIPALDLHHIPQRIISLVPSQTELLCDLGLEEKIVGITKFCVHPTHLKASKTIIGGTKKVNFEKIRSLAPDLIIANKEENTLEMVLELQKICPVLVTEIITISDNFNMISHFGNTLGCRKAAEELNKKLEFAYDDFKKFISEKPTRRAVYFIWKNPYMGAGGDTFINEMLAVNHFENSCRNELRYPEIELKNILPNENIDLILLSSEPFPFTENDRVEIESATNVKTIVVDGEMFSWYGSRLLKAFDYFKNLHKALH